MVKNDCPINFSVKSNSEISQSYISLSLCFCVCLSLCLCLIYSSLPNNVSFVALLTVASWRIVRKQPSHSEEILGCYSSTRIPSFSYFSYVREIKDVSFQIRAKLWYEERISVREVFDFKTGEALENISSANIIPPEFLLPPFFSCLWTFLGQSVVCPRGP